MLNQQEHERYALVKIDLFKKTKKFRVNFGESPSIKEETDRILDKINEKGFGSLTDSEKETLEKAKKLLGK